MKKHTTDEDVLILAIESSCDETAASVVRNGRLTFTRCMEALCLRSRRESILRKLTR